MRIWSRSSPRPIFIASPLSSHCITFAKCCKCTSINSPRWTGLVPGNHEASMFIKIYEARPFSTHAECKGMWVQLVKEFRSHHLFFETAPQKHELIKLFLSRKTHVNICTQSATQDGCITFIRSTHLHRTVGVTHQSSQCLCSPLSASGSVVLRVIPQSCLFQILFKIYPQARETRALIPCSQSHVDGQNTPKLNQAHVGRKCSHACKGCDLACPWPR